MHKWAEFDSALSPQSLASEGSQEARKETRIAG